MMTNEPTVREEIETIWQRIVENQSLEATRVDVVAELQAVDRNTSQDAQEHLAFWLTLLDEALHCLLTMYEFADELSVEKDVSAITFRALLARGCALTVAIRRLIKTGLEDVARIVARSLLENLDLALVCLANRNFAQQYHSALEDERYDANEFWREHISGDRLNEKVRRVFSSTNMTEEQVNFYFANRKLSKRQFSGSVHSSAHSALFSDGIPSLSEPGMISTSILGHISLYSPGALSFIVMEVRRFGVIFFHLVTTNNSPAILRGVKDVPSYANVYAAFLTLQEITERYSDAIPPPFDFPDTEDDT